VKWQPFKTMPEQYERLEQYILDQNKIERPILSEDQLNELNDTLVYKMFHDQSLTVRYYKDGYIENEECIIHKVSDLEQYLYIHVEDELRKISLMDIVDIK